MRWSAIDGVLNQNLPSVRGLLKRIQVECNQVIEEVAFHLPTEDVDLAAENVQRVAIATWRARARRQSSRPLLGGWNKLARGLSMKSFQ